MEFTGWETLRVNVFDEYEGKELLGRGVSLTEAATIMQAREEDTDGECDVHCYFWASGIDVTHIVSFYAPTEF